MRIGAFALIAACLLVAAAPQTWSTHLVSIALARYSQLSAIDVSTTAPAAGSLPLTDVAGGPIGSLTLTFRDGVANPQIAGNVQALFSKHLISAANLGDPYPYSSQYTPNTAAQAIDDETLVHHPELLVLGFHVTLPERGNVFLASNIGRVGKLADDDDMRVVRTGKPNYEISADGRRYEVELVLEDVTGTNIGALGTVFRNTPAADKSALNARAFAIRDEIARRIPSAVALAAPRGSALVANGSTAIPGYKGDFDHFAVDTKGGRLFLAGEDGAQLLVFDLRDGVLLRTIPGFGAPHSPFYFAKTNELFIIDGLKPAQVRDATTLALKRKVVLPAGADSAAYDASTGHLWIVTGGKDVGRADSTLIEVDPATGKTYNRTHFDANHVEALVVEQHGNRVFINVTDKNRMAVIDKRNGKITAWWPIRAAEQNAPLAFDEVHHRLFVVTRDPGKLIVLDSETGATVATFDCPQRADQAVWDAANARVYVPGGDGRIGVYREDGPSQFTQLPFVRSATGAKTAILVPALDRFYVAASPGDTRVGGALLRFDVLP